MRVMLVSFMVMLSVLLLVLVGNVSGGGVVSATGIVVTSHVVVGGVIALLFVSCTCSGRVVAIAGGIAGGVVLSCVDGTGIVDVWTCCVCVTVVVMVWP